MGKSIRAWACVSRKKHIKVDTVCVDRESAEFMLDGKLKGDGYRVRRVRVVLEADHSR